MGIFRRTRDIVNANVNSLLDRAEDPEKLIRLMDREMVETLVRVKSARANMLTVRGEILADLRQTAERQAAWADRARLAVDKGRDDLAREALVEKRRFAERSEHLERELAQTDRLVEQYDADIAALEAKISQVRERERLLTQRHVRARRAHEVRSRIRRFDTSQAMMRFDEFEHRIERMEAGADLVDFGRKPTLEEEFARLGADEDIERELAALKGGPATAQTG